MPRAISVELKARIAEDGLLALLVLAELQNGTVLAYTSFDQPITFDGHTFEPTPGLAPSTVRSTLGTGVDTAQVASAAIDGVFDLASVIAQIPSGAATKISVVAPDLLSAGELVLRRGVIGEVTTDGRAAQIEDRGLQYLLRVAEGAGTSKQCRCQRLGDVACGVNLAGTSVGGRAIKATRTISSVGASIVLAAESAPSGYYALGTIKITSGPNAGIERDIRSHTNVSGTAEITVIEPFPFALAAGVTCEVTAGCDRLFATCDGKFANSRRFCGEPYLIGNDAASAQGRAGL